MNNLANNLVPQEEITPIITINGKPAVRLPGDFHLVSEFAENLGRLVKGHGIYVRKGIAFTLNLDTQRLEPATPTWLRTWVEKHAVPFRNSNQGGDIQITKSMSKDNAEAVLASEQFLDQLPKVERFHPCPMPVLRKDGSIELLPIGLDEESHTFTADPEFLIEPDSLIDARMVLDTLLNEFAWPDDQGRSKAVHIAAMLTVFAGGIMPPDSIKPVFFYTSNAEGSGKTTLAQLAGMPYRSTPVETAPKDEAEWQKKLLTVAISGRRLLLLDNLKGHLNSGAFEAYTTSSQFTGRILGGSKEFTGEAGATVLITGNGLTITPDLRRRSLFVELFLKELRAEDRKFKRILDPYAIASMRREVLCALWGLVHEWDKARRKDASVQNASFYNSSFPRWCESIAAIVEFAGYGCPTIPAEIDGMGDTDTADISSLLEVMESGKHYEFSDLTNIAIEQGLFERFTSDLDPGNPLELSRRAKRQFASILKRYDNRRVKDNPVFLVQGKGHSRRYLKSSDT